MAFFFDFDGVLAPIVDNPADARPSPRMLAYLTGLVAISGGAVAVVSGRPMEELDRLLAPLRLPLAGIHGRQRRDASGRVELADVTAPELVATDARLSAYSDAHEGTLVERKPGAVALHFRKRPELESEARALTRKISRQAPALRLIEGKMVAEFAVGAHSKGDAISAFLEEMPFAGRRPAYFGDDVTDEDAYPVVDAAGGISVRIGDGQTLARYWLESVDALEGWLAALVEAK